HGHLMEDGVAPILTAVEECCSRLEGEVLVADPAHELADRRQRRWKRRVAREGGVIRPARGCLPHAGSNGGERSRCGDDGEVRPFGHLSLLPLDDSWRPC